MTNDSKPKLKMLTFHYVDGGPDYINFLRPTLEQEAEIRGLLRRLESQGTIEEPRFGDRGREVAAGLYDSLFWLYSRTTDIEPAFSGIAGGETDSTPTVDEPNSDNKPFWLTQVF